MASREERPSTALLALKAVSGPVGCSRRASSHRCCADDSGVDTVWIGSKDVVTVFSGPQAADAAGTWQCHLYPVAGVGVIANPRAGGVDPFRRRTK